VRVFMWGVFLSVVFKNSGCIASFSGEVVDYWDISLKGTLPYQKDPAPYFCVPVVFENGPCPRSIVTSFSRYVDKDQKLWYVFDANVPWHNGTENNLYTAYLPFDHHGKLLDVGHARPAMKVHWYGRTSCLSWNFEGLVCQDKIFEITFQKNLSFISQ
jgi:hypothetical protein